MKIVSIIIFLLWFIVFEKQLKIIITCVLLLDSHIPLPEDKLLQGFIMLESAHSKLM